MSDQITEKTNENEEPELVMSVYDKAVDKVNELYRDYKAHCKENNEFEHSEFVYGGIYFCAKRIIEIEEKHKAEIAKLNTLIDSLVEEIRRSSGDCKFCGLNDHCPCGKNYDQDFCPSPELSKHNILKYFAK